LTGYVAYYGLKAHLPALSGTRSEKRETGGREGRERRESAREGGRQGDFEHALLLSCPLASSLFTNLSPPTFTSNCFYHHFVLWMPAPPFFSTQVATPFGPEKPASQPASLPARNERELVLELEVFLGV
jgi:hypothetical protein